MGHLSENNYITEFFSMQYLLCIKVGGRVAPRDAPGIKLRLTPALDRGNRDLPPRWDSRGIRHQEWNERRPRKTTLRGDGRY